MRDNFPNFKFVYTIANKYDITIIDLIKILKNHFPNKTYWRNTALTSEEVRIIVKNLNHKKNMVNMKKGLKNLN